MSNAIESALPGDFGHVLLAQLAPENFASPREAAALRLMREHQYWDAAQEFDALSAGPNAPAWIWLLAGYCYVAADTADAAGEALYFLQIAAHRDAGNGWVQYCLGLAWHKAGDKTAARVAFAEARRLLPALPAAAVYEAITLFELDQYPAALALLEAVLQDYPDDPDILNQTGLVLLRGFGQAQQALPLFRRAALRPGRTRRAAHINQALALRCLGQYAEAITLYDKLVSEEDEPYLRWQRGLALLSAHVFARAWDDYGHRWCLPGVRTHAFRFRPWMPPAADSETIAVLSEQGLGDQIMFSTCVPDLIRSVAPNQCHVVIECNPKLQKLFARSFASAQVVARETNGNNALIGHLSTRPCRQIFMGDLPGLYRRKTADFPTAAVLKSDPKRTAYWRARLDKLGGGAKIGISWRGGLAGTNAALRSVDLAILSPLFRLPGCRFVSLQYGECEPELAYAKAHGIELAHWNDAIENYDETAALVDSLDYVVSVCTSLVHLAGALGQATAVLVPAVPEWAFGGASDTMPWYPSVRLFRQTTLEDWSVPVEQIAATILRAAATPQ